MEAFFVSTLVVAIAEIGDKTQIATVALAAQFNDMLLVRWARPWACC
ncbi:TMEM165/GDT1 family protein [Telmatospirillum sp. J64-1]|nr:TMEM165/GDT1 family protein [Telmatospirillum sp. J64-1]